MTFNNNARLDPSRVQDRRGMGRSGMGRGGKGVAVGGGAGVLLLLFALLTGNTDLLNLVGGTGVGGTGQEQTQGQPLGAREIDECDSGADANARIDCRILGTAQSLDAFWQPYLEQYNVAYAKPGVVIFSEATNTGCGGASSATGPFYCPADTNTYFDTGFFGELKDRFGASGGPLAEEYVVAHEFGHHVQSLIGTLAASQQDGTGPESGAVRVELQADCFAGLWAASAATQPDPATGQPFLAAITQKDLTDALSAASAVGDDRIQEAATGRVNPEAWTHGSSEQRQAWFTQGYNTGDINRCDTLNAADLDNPS